MIKQEIKKLSEDTSLIEKAKILDDKLPSSAQWMNDNILKLSSKGYADFFDKDNETVKEGLKKVEKYAKEELYSSETERSRCKDTINAEGSQVKSWDDTSLWVKTSKEQYDSVINVNTYYEPDIEANIDLCDSDKDRNKNKNNTPSSPNEDLNRNYSTQSDIINKQDLSSNVSSPDPPENSGFTSIITENKKPTPGHYIDSLPQDMPGFMDEPD